MFVVSKESGSGSLSLRKVPSGLAKTRTTHINYVNVKLDDSLTEFREKAQL